MMMHRLHPTPEVFETMEMEALNRNHDAHPADEGLSLRWLALAALLTVVLMSLAVLL